MQEGHQVLNSVVGLSAAGMEPGYDKTNQDFICIQPLGKGPSNEKSYMFAVLDGHGVEGAAPYARAAACVLCVSTACMPPSCAFCYSGCPTGSHCTQQHELTCHCIHHHQINLIKCISRAVRAAAAARICIHETATKSAHKMMCEADASLAGMHLAIVLRLEHT
jgi:serine/threonine protein phosphatase PrpC